MFSLVGSFFVRLFGCSHACLLACPFCLLGWFGLLGCFVLFVRLVVALDCEFAILSVGWHG